MFRLIAFLVVVLALGFLFAWFADRPGAVSLVWQGMRYETSLMVAVAALVGLVASLMALWWIGSTILRSPALMRRFFRNRRRDRGYHALSQGLIAAGSGDAATARRLARDSRKLLGGEALVELLDAQTLLLENNHDDARARFEKMLDDDDTKLVALRGLHLEAEREGAREAARHYAEEAARLAPSLPWAGAAMLRHLTAEGDWQGALKIVETMRASGAMPKDEAQRKRAVLLTGEAISQAQAAPDKAAKLAREAHRLADDLVPAAVVAATALVRTGDVKRAASILETTWKKSPHPEIAAHYVHLRPGDSVGDRLKRARRLESLAADHDEGRFAVAEAAVAARDWGAAREAMATLVAANPTRRACLLMADIEEGESGDRGRTRQWLARAVRAPADPAWMADGVSSAYWLPVSPVSGRIDAFEWKAPAAMLGAPASAEPEEPEVEEDAVTVEPDPVAPPPAEETQAKAPPAPAGIVEVAPIPAPQPGDGEVTEHPAETKPGQATPPRQEEAQGPIVLPLGRPPDDPGVEPGEAEEEKKGFRLF